MTRKSGPLLVRRQFIRTVIAFCEAHSFSSASRVSRLAPIFLLLRPCQGKRAHTHPVCLSETGFRGIVLFPHRERKSKRKRETGRDKTLGLDARSGIVACNSWPRNQFPLSGAVLTDPTRQSKGTGNHRARGDRAGIAAKSRRKKGGGVVCACVDVLLVAPELSINQPCARHIQLPRYHSRSPSRGPAADIALARLRIVRLPVFRESTARGVRFRVEYALHVALSGSCVQAAENPSAQLHSDRQ